MQKRKVLIDESGNRTLESDDDCRLNYSFRASPVVSRALLVLSTRLEELAAQRKDIAAELLRVSVMTKREAKTLKPWLDAASAEARRTKARRALKNKASKDVEVPREHCSNRGCYGPEWRDGLCRQHYDLKKVK